MHSLPPVVSAKERQEAEAAGEPDPENVSPQDQIADANLPSGFDVTGDALPEPETEPDNKGGTTGNNDQDGYGQRRNR